MNIQSDQDTCYYNNWKCNYNVIRSFNTFVEKLAENQVTYFELVQHANMAGAYIRCFFMLNNDTSKTYYEVLYDKKWLFTHNGTQALTDSSFTQLKQDFQLIYSSHCLACFSRNK